MVHRYLAVQTFLVHNLKFVPPSDLIGLLFQRFVKKKRKKKYTSRASGTNNFRPPRRWTSNLRFFHFSLLTSREMTSQYICNARNLQPVDVSALKLLTVKIKTNQFARRKVSESMLTAVYETISYLLQYLTIIFHYPSILYYSQ